MTDCRTHHFAARRDGQRNCRQLGARDQAGAHPDTNTYVYRLHQGEPLWDEEPDARPPRLPGSRDPQRPPR